MCGWSFISQQRVFIIKYIVETYLLLKDKNYPKIGEKIIFCSNWVKKRFLKNINENYINDDKFLIINHSITHWVMIGFIGEFNKNSFYITKGIRNRF